MRNNAPTRKSEMGEGILCSPHYPKIHSVPHNKKKKIRDDEIIFVHCTYTQPENQRWAREFCARLGVESAAYLGVCEELNDRRLVQNSPPRMIFKKKEGVFFGTHLLENLVTDYQLAFLTPGIRPAEAISRNWIRLMPN